MTDSVVEKIKDTFESILRDRKKLIKILSVLLILVAAAVLKIIDTSKADITIESAETAETAQETDPEEEVYEDTQTICVDIGGAVVNPGVYQVTKDTRLYEVIDMAGGLKEDADMDSVNRASFVEDCQKIIIPVKGSSENSGTDVSSVSSSPGITAEGLVNINTATLDELKTLNGIGDVIAERIIEYRSSNAFKSKEDVMSVNGIGKAVYEKIKDHIIC
ncbi:MAG: helix-hairpin-helix domain-containing protein [Mogibacterium sp.]|nr:helix-hairpin-helix domain-containing protein [Mogibacterium sp.]